MLGQTVSIFPLETYLIFVAEYFVQRYTQVFFLDGERSFTYTLYM